MMSVSMPKQELVPLSKLKGAEYNPRVMADAEMLNLMRSLAEFGFVQPVLARKEDGLILGGHQRVEAMRRIIAKDGETDAEIPVIWLSGITDDRAKVLNVALNRIHGEWDYQKLGELFSGIELPDLTVSGFSAEEIEDIMRLTVGDLGIPPPDEAADAEDIDSALAIANRKFSFEVATDEDAKLCKEVFAVFGMTGPGNAGATLLAVVKAARASKSQEKFVEQVEQLQKTAKKPKPIVIRPPQTLVIDEDEPA